MHRSLFTRIFPPPKLLTFNYAGLDINDDGIYCLRYKDGLKGLHIDSNIAYRFDERLIEGGDISKKEVLIKNLKDIQHKMNLNYVRVSVPEEKSYLFMTDVPNLDNKSIRQNIESKIEENVPISAADALFYHEIIPRQPNHSAIKVSVSVVPRNYIENYISIIEEAGMNPIAFEVAPRAIAKAIFDENEKKTSMIVHSMKDKIGLYIAVNGVVCFASTSQYSQFVETDLKNQNKIQFIKNEINRIYSYWQSHGIGTKIIDEILVVGESALQIEEYIHEPVDGQKIPLLCPMVWKNAIGDQSYVPPISREDSMNYAVASGLAIH
jgi:hypothetical protein